MGQYIILRYNSCSIFFYKEVTNITIKKEQIIKILYKCAKEFEANLANKRVMFIVEAQDKTLEKEEVFFPTSVFYHLTGIIAKDKNGKEYTLKRGIHEKDYGEITYIKKGYTLEYVMEKMKT